MSPRLPRADFVRRQGAANKRAFKQIVQTGDPPGILANESEMPIGWRALATREIYVRLEHSRVLKPVDNQSPLFHGRFAHRKAIAIMRSVY